jgi:hypothetical protein
MRRTASIIRAMSRASPSRLNATSGWMRGSGAASRTQPSEKDSLTQATSEPSRRPIACQNVLDIAVMNMSCGPQPG